MHLQVSSFAVCMPAFDGCYLTDVGADASLPEALTAELHCHLTAHSVLLTDLLKSFLPNNQASQLLIHWSTAYRDSSHLQKKNPHPTPILFLLSLPTDRLAHAINWNDCGLTHTQYSSGQKQQGKWQLCWLWLIEALHWVSTAVASREGAPGCNMADAVASDAAS